jgi:hypothetical protein
MLLAQCRVFTSFAEHLPLGAALYWPIRSLIAMLLHLGWIRKFAKFLTVSILLLRLWSTCSTCVAHSHRYLMSRLPLHGFYQYVMYCRQRRYFYYCSENLKYYLAPLPRSSPFTGGQRWQPIQMGHSLHIRAKWLGEGGGRSFTITNF